ncbi:MAG: sigma 54-interacting transcriptional regulator [Desulfobacterales bacterium]
MDISKYWKTVIDTLRDGLLVVDPRGNILAANPSAEKLTGYSEKELIGHSCRLLNCTGCKIQDKGEGVNWCELYSLGKIRDKQCQITHKDGRTLDIVKSASVLRDKVGKIIGAVETLTDISELVKQQREILSLKKSCHLEKGFYGILGSSPPMEQLFELIENVSQTDAPVMILGASGTGKELVARAIHDAGSRAGKPFIKVNCAALNENLLESELFGHVKGAYTGADRNRIGRFEAAQEGTIFLDEIGDITLSTQVKLLRVLEEKQIERVGDHRPFSVNVRIVTATNRNLEKLVEKQYFREDLFFRINVFPLYCPCLSERREDIPVIVQSFIKRNNAESGKNILGFTPEAMEKLLNYGWPGNVRELRNVVEYAFVLCPGDYVHVQHLPPKIISPASNAADMLFDSRKKIDRTREELVRALRMTSGNQSKAASILGVSRVTVWKRLKKYGIDPGKNF